MHQLSSLDLSSNNLSGSIPPILSSLSFLGYLNLSNNNFSGTIPNAEHLTTFDASSFAGNPALCGPPLNVKCMDEDSDGGGSVNPDDNKLFISGFTRVLAWDLQLEFYFKYWFHQSENLGAMPTSILCTELLTNGCVLKTKDL